VEHHDRVVDGEAHHAHDAGQHGQVELVPGHREPAGAHEHVVHGRQDRRDRELPFEPERDVGEEADDHEQHRVDAVLGQLTADLRADLGAAARGGRIAGLRGGLRDRVAHAGGAVAGALVRLQPHQQVVAAAEGLVHRVVYAGRGLAIAYIGHVPALYATHTYAHTAC